MILQHNLQAANIKRQLGITNKALSKTTEKLSSGYRVNRAADDAAHLQTSEKKRAQIRGLLRSVKNAEEGIGFIQTGDGAMNEAHSILQRMQELCIQSSNDTYTDADRAIMQMEFDALQSEIDKINDQTEYNTLNVFEHYADSFYSYQGNRVWSQDQPHNVTPPDNSLTVTYQISETEPEKTITFTIPPGTYTTQELMDEMDTVITELGAAADGLYLEFTQDGTCNMVLQNGELISDVSGGLSYLFFDEYVSSQMGSLIGTTIFDPNFPLIINDRNNHMICSIENFDGSSQKVEITLDSGAYTRQDMIDYLNKKLEGTGMTASEYGDYSIQLGSEDGIITGLKGNMFLIDDAGDVMVSVFYDNTKYGSVEKTPATFTGGAVLPASTTDTSHNQFHIDNTNNTLKIKVNADENQPYQEITLDTGDFSMQQMVTQLQNKLTAAGCDVTVDHYIDTVTTSNGNRLSFRGITIKSNQVGRDSNISFDTADSTAYNTLFVDRNYTDIGHNVTTSNGNYSYTKPTLNGGKTFRDGDFPLIIDNTNNSFQITVREQTTDANGNIITRTTTHTITIPNGTYNSLSEIVDAMKNQIENNVALAGLKGKVEVISSVGRICLQPTADNRTITGINFANTTTEPYATGYDTLFVGKTTSLSKDPIKSPSATQPTITLDKITFPAVFNDTNNQLNVNVGGVNRPVIIPPGTYDRDQLLNEINQQLKGTTTNYPQSFSASGRGSSTNNNKNLSNSGKINKRGTISCIETGSGGTQDGSTAIVDPKPAHYTVQVPLKNLTPVTSENNAFSITVNSQNYTVELDPKPNGYSPAELADALNKKLDEKITGQANKVTVTLTSDNKLDFTTNSKGKAITMSFDDSSPLMHSINYESTPASISTGLSLQNSINIGDGSNTFTITVNGHPQTVTLANNPSYTPSSFLEELKRKLEPIGVIPTLSSNRLVLTTAATGPDTSLAFDTNNGNGGSAISAMFGELKQEKPASAALSTPLQNPVNIKAGSDVFRIDTVENGASQRYEVTIPEGVYTRDQLASKLNDLLGGKVAVSTNGYNSLTFTTTATGSNTSIAVNNTINDAQDSAASSMFGERTVTTPDIVASFDDQDQLVLTGSSSSSRYTISVTPNENSGLAKPVETITKTPPSAQTGQVTMRYYTLKSSTQLSNGVTITSKNKDFHFDYHGPTGTPPTQSTISVDITLDERAYSPQELQTALQNKINEALNDPSALTVTATDTGISIKAQNYGSEYYLNNYSGGFYDNILIGTTDMKDPQDTSMVEGKQILSDTYIIGRKDVRNNPVNIREGSNDKLSIDVTINNTVHTLDMTLSPGQYNTQSLLQELQTKIDEQVNEKGLPEHCILVDVGKFDSGVVGADDANSLDIYINPDAELDTGDYRIDGLTGSSLFEIFYKTTGDIVPAYTTGTKDISQGVTIEPDNNELSIDVDGITYTYTIPAGEYTAEEFIETLKKLFDAPDNNGNTALITPSLSGNALKIASKKLGKHSVENIQGSAKPTIFYSSEGRKDYDSTLYLQVGANANQMLKLQRFSISTITLGINSITVSKTKYAQKALDRVQKAIDNLNGKRSEYGAKQNRLDHTVASNNNTQENLQISESADRDANMALEMVALSRQKIIQQAGTAMMAQANRNTSSVLTLLK